MHVHLCRYGWQIDPFGHSNVVHNQFAQMGFNATVLQRISYLSKNLLIQNSSLEFIWQTSASQGADSNVCFDTVPVSQSIC